MIFVYDILFSIKACLHRPGEAPLGASPEFLIQPTSDCIDVLKQFKLLYKSVEGGGIVLQEKRGANRESVESKSPLTQNAKFRFTLKIKDPTLLSRIIPFVSGTNSNTQPVELPSILGNKAVLLFDNLDDANTIKTTTINSECQEQIILDTEGNPDRDANGDFQYEPVAVIPLSSVNSGVTLDDLASTIPNRFNNIPENVTSFDIFPTQPGLPIDVPENLNPPDDTSAVPYYVLDGAYRVEQTKDGSSTEEALFASNSLLNTTDLGVIQIFKQNDTSINFEIKFNLLSD